MLFKGTDTFGPGYIDRTVEGTGGRSNAFTAVRLHDLPGPVPGEATPTAIQLLDDMAFRSKFDPKEVDAERKVIFEESRIETDTPRTAIVRQLYGMVFAAHPYGRPVLGTPATMNAATQDNLKAFNRRFYTPENMALVVVGPVDAKAVRGPWSTAPSAGAPAPGTRRRPFRRWRPSRRACRARWSGRSSRRTWRSAGRRPARRIATACRWISLATILGAARARAWPPRLRDSERIVSRVSMSNSTLQLAGMFTSRRSSRRGTSRRSSGDILEEIARLQREGPTEEERRAGGHQGRVRARLRLRDLRRGGLRVRHRRRPPTLDDELRYIERLRTITREQIRDAARKYLPRTAYARLAFVPRKAQMSRRALAPARRLLALLAGARRGLAQSRRRSPQPAAQRAHRARARELRRARRRLLAPGEDGHAHGDAGQRRHLEHAAVMLVRGTEKMNGEQIVGRRRPDGRQHRRLRRRGLLGDRRHRALAQLAADARAGLRRRAPAHRAGRHRGGRCATSSSGRSGTAGTSPSTSPATGPRALFGRHPYAWDPLGRKESVERLTVTRSWPTTGGSTCRARWCSR